MVGGSRSARRSRPTPSRSTARAARPTQILDDAGFPKKSGEMVLVQSKSAKTADDPAFKAAVADVTKTVSKQTVVTNVTKRRRSPRTGTPRSSSSTSRVIPRPPTSGSGRCSTPPSRRRHAPPRRWPSSSSATQPRPRRSPTSRGRGEGRSQMMSLGSTLLILLIDVRRARRRLRPAAPRRHRRLRHRRPRRASPAS